MRARIRIWIAATLYYCGLVPLIRWWTRRASPRLLILNYHRASDGDLRRQLLYLRRHYRILHLDAALDELYQTHKAEKEHMKVPNKGRTLLALTFDDGYYDNYTHAARLASELEVPLTIFLVPGYIENGHTFWWLEGQHLVTLARSREVTLEGTTYHLDRSNERAALIAFIDTRARCATSVAEREEFLQSLALSLDVSLVEGREEPARPLTWMEVQEMAKSSWISFGAHTLHHPVLAYLDDVAEVRSEIEQSRAILEQRLGCTVRVFAYPLGKPEHIGTLAPSLVQAAGYQWAVTTVPGLNTRLSNPYLLQRKNAGANQHWLVLAAEITGVWQALATGYRILRGRR